LLLAAIGTTWHVPGDASAIQGEMGVASAGYAVQMAPGIYMGGDYIGSGSGCDPNPSSAVRMEQATRSSIKDRYR
ncbi:MAG: hypothetical protein R3D98_06510, partial [Candidatus Krumholzibacteriia bacterium]